MAFFEYHPPSPGETGEAYLKLVTESPRDKIKTISKIIEATRYKREVLGDFSSAEVETVHRADYKEGKVELKTFLRIAHHLGVEVLDQNGLALIPRKKGRMDLWDEEISVDNLAHDDDPAVTGAVKEFGFNCEAHQLQPLEGFNHVDHTSLGNKIDGKYHPVLTVLNESHDVRRLIAREEALAA